MMQVCFLEQDAYSRAHDDQWRVVMMSAPLLTLLPVSPVSRCSHTPTCDGATRLPGPGALLKHGPGPDFPPGSSGRQLLHWCIGHLQFCRWGCGGASVLPQPGPGGECGEEQQGQQLLPRHQAGGGAGPHQADARLHTERGQEMITMFLSSQL